MNEPLVFIRVLTVQGDQDGLVRVSEILAVEEQTTDTLIYLDSEPDGLCVLDDADQIWRKLREAATCPVFKAYDGSLIFARFHGEDGPIIVRVDQIVSLVGNDFGEEVGTLVQLRGFRLPFNVTETLDEVTKSLMGATDAKTGLLVPSSADVERQTIAVGTEKITDSEPAGNECFYGPLFGGGQKAE